MKISIIGTGRMGKGIIKTLDAIHEDLYWGSRNINQVVKLSNELNLKNTKPVTLEESLSADIIIPTLWFKDLIPWVESYRQFLDDKILIDIVNPFTDDFNDFTTDWNTSAAEELQKMIPNTWVVGAFKNTFFKVFDQPIINNTLSDVYVTSNSHEKKTLVIELLKSLPFRILDGGTLKNNRIIERITLFERELAIRYGSYPYVSNRIFGLENITKETV